MLKQNRLHLSRVAVYGGALVALGMAAGSFLWGGGFALGVLIGGALSIGNIYSIIMLVEAAAGAALGEGAGPASRSLAIIMHLFKLILIVVIILLLLITKTGDPFGIITGFTLVLATHGVVGFMKARENLIEEALEAEREERDA